MNLKPLLFLLSGFLLLGGTYRLHAQGVTTSAMRGVVLDAKGAPLPGASVVATHLPSGTQYGASTRENGQYDLLNLRIGGPYELKVSFVGFQTFTQNDIQLVLGKTHDSRITLTEEGLALDEIVVRGNSGVINNDRTGASTNINNNAIRTLPTISRSTEDFTRLTPQSSGLSFGGRNSLYNNFSLDGSIFNNSFGLDAPTPGGQTNSQPVSLDAIEQIEVSLAPYDVRQGGFTGAGVNAVTKSGTNDFKGTVYSYFRNENLIGNRVGDVEITNPELNFNQTGLRLGGPIVRNKLFFFVNAEVTRRDDPGQTFRPARSAQEAQAALNGQAPGISRVLESDLITIRQRLLDVYGYDVGAYQDFIFQTYSDKFLAKLDLNLGKTNTFSVRYNYLKSWREQGPHPIAIAPSSRVPSVNTLQFANSGYTINNNLHSVVAELNSNFAQKISNKLQVSYSAFRDFRELPTTQRFPMIDITQGGTTYASVGTEQFSAENRLDQNIFQVTDNVSYFANAHVLTGGFTYEGFGFVNDFNLQRFGYPFFGGLDYNVFLQITDPASPFYKKNPFTLDANGNPTEDLDLNAVARAGGERPVKSVKVNVAQLGLYAQDEWQLRPNFKLTLGLRADLPIYMTDVAQNTQVAAASFLDPDGTPTQVDVTNFPKATPLWSPRVGFNYSRSGGAYTTQVRGGTGIFTGRIPFVWVGNQASNAGFDNFYTFQVNATANNFRFPQVWRSNLAVDQELPGGITATVEAIYTKDLNAAIHRNYNQVVPTERAAGADNRLIYPPTGPRLNTNFTGPNGIPTFLDAGVIVLENTRQGYQYSLTGQLQKNFSTGLYLMGAYTFSRAKDVTSNPGEIAADAFQRNPVIGNSNTPALAFSDFGLQHRVIAAAGKRFEYAKFMATTISFFFEAGQGGRFSYTYAGDMNRDGVFGNDLIFVPAAPTRSAWWIIPTPGATW
jgi:outer membrane receptor protein involved in Fe transport